MILGSCYSGSFISALSSARRTTDAGRVVISSAAADEQSYKGPNEPDGIRSGEFFLEELFKELKKGASFRAAFVEATALTETFTSQGSGSANSMNAYQDQAVQHPLLDDDGDGPGSNSLSDGFGDGVGVRPLHLGVGATNASFSPADIKAVTNTLYLDANTSQAQLWSEAYSNNAVSSAWFEVKSPEHHAFDEPHGNGTGQLDLDIPRWLMTLSGTTGKWEATYGRFVKDRGDLRSAGQVRSLLLHQEHERPDLRDEAVGGVQGHGGQHRAASLQSRAPSDAPQRKRHSRSSGKRPPTLTA